MLIRKKSNKQRLRRSEENRKISNNDNHILLKSIEVNAMAAAVPPHNTKQKRHTHQRWFKRHVCVCVFIFSDWFAFHCYPVFVLLRFLIHFEPLNKFNQHQNSRSMFLFLLLINICYNFREDVFGQSNQNFSNTNFRLWKEHKNEKKKTSNKF